jgi:hypothetical protein
MLSRTSSGRRVANISVQATPVYVSCEFLSRLPGAPDRGRSAAHSQHRQTLICPTQFWRFLTSAEERSF